MLLTQSQISAAISSTIVLTFTILLFLAGYTLQQQTVTSLQAAIRPRLQALKALPQAQDPSPRTTTVPVAFGDAGAPLKVSAQTGVGDDGVEGDVYEYIEGSVNGVGVENVEGDGSSESQSGLRLTTGQGRGTDRTVTDEHREDEEEGDGRKGKLLSLDEWTYSDESPGQKRMREGFAVLDDRVVK